MIITIGKLKVGRGQPVRFVADIGANHDGSLDRAKMLIELARQAGADIVKFQNFRADHIVSDYGFRQLGKTAHQAEWEKSVYEVYQDASLPFEWIPILKEHCDKVGIEFMSTPYDFGAVGALEPYVNAFKIGSGDINYQSLIEYIAQVKKPIIISCGASYEYEVGQALAWIKQYNPEVILLQCNTNYSGDWKNARCTNLRAMKAMRDKFQVEVGLSDHNRLSTVVLGAVALGACLIERHFTDNCRRTGPDHHFALEPEEWVDMVNDVRDLEEMMGSGEKEVEDNERESRIVQRRCLRATRDMKVGEIIRVPDITSLRPAPVNSIEPKDSGLLLGRCVSKDIVAGEHFTWSNVL